MPTTSTFSPTVATVDLSALAHNLTAIKRYLAPGCDVMAVVKANAYGHGAADVTRALLRSGVSRFAVVSVEEGLALRQAGINAPIVVLGALFSEHIPDLIAHQLTPVISDASILPTLSRAAATLSAPYPIHLKVETGMGRLGLSVDSLRSFLQSPDLRSPLQIEGLMTHLADSDGPTEDATERQLGMFRKAAACLTDMGCAVPLLHAANSAGLVRFPASRFSLVRPGIMLYGYHTLPASVSAPKLHPVLSLRTTIAQLRTVSPGCAVSYNGTFVAKRPTRVAVLPIGYADGYSRRLSNRGRVLIHGHRVPIIGSVCMDMTLVDVTDLHGPRVGDEVILIGRQGDGAIGADEIADWTGTISYEVLCSIGPRVPRHYLSA